MISIMNWFTLIYLNIYIKKYINLKLHLNKQVSNAEEQNKLN